VGTSTVITLNVVGSDTLRSLGEERVLVARVEKPRGTEVLNGQVQFAADDPSVLLVTRVDARTARIRAAKDGETKVSARTGDAGVSRAFIVRRHVTDFKLGVGGIPNAASLTVGGAVTLEVLAFDSLGSRIASPGTLTLTSADTTIARVDSEAVVTAVGPGSTIITGRLTTATRVFVATWHVSVFLPFP
jgi:hypothetical protein